NGSNMTSSVKSGVAFVEGRYYYNDALLQLTHDTEVVGLSRIDRIVVRMDLSTDARYVKVFIKKGVPAASPLPPTLTQTTQLYEISLAQVLVVGGQTYIAANAVTDERGKDIICPWAGSKILPSFDNNALTQHMDEYEQQLGTAELQTTDKTLKGAINEVKQSANDIKSKWASVIGSPLVSTDTQAQLQSKTQTIKNTLATNLSNKGQSASGTETLTSLVNKVANVNTGKRFATGLTSGPGSITVSGLEFRPRTVLISLESIYVEPRYRWIVYSLEMPFNTAISKFISGSNTDDSIATNTKHSGITINTDGFSVSGLGINPANCYWVAFE